MTAAAILAALGCVAAVAWALSERAARVRLERRLARSSVHRRRQGARLRKQRDDLAELRGQMPRFRMPRPPLAHRADPDKTAVIVDGRAA